MSEVCEHVHEVASERLVAGERNRLVALLNARRAKRRRSCCDSALWCPGVADGDESQARAASMAQRLSQPDVPTSLRAIVTPAITPLALSMEPLPTNPKLARLSPGRCECRLTVSQSVQDKLDETRALLDHAVSSARCAFVSDNGRRCEDRKVSRSITSACGQGRRRRRWRKSIGWCAIAAAARIYGCQFASLARRQVGAVRNGLNQLGVHDRVRPDPAIGVPIISGSPVTGVVETSWAFCRRYPGPLR